jgi:hypothetical protein
MEEASEDGKESPNSAHGNGMDECYVVVRHNYVTTYMCCDVFEGG